MGRAYQNRKESMAKTPDAKAKVYSKYGREIYVVAKNGGTDPNGNLSLRRLIDNAKKDQVPAHVIEKAVKKYQMRGNFFDGLYCNGKSCMDLTNKERREKLKKHVKEDEFEKYIPMIIVKNENEIKDFMENGYYVISHDKWMDFLEFK